MIRRGVLGGALLMALAGAAPVPGGVLSVRVTNIRNARGRIHIEVCPETRFLKDDCPYVGVATAQAGTTMVTVHGIPAGHYAVQAFHDENVNGKVDRALFGIPKEGVGFSNDALTGMSAPKWERAMFAFDGREQTIQLKLRYFL